MDEEMNLKEEIINNFKRGFVNKAMKIKTLPEQYEAWTYIDSETISVWIPTNGHILFSEEFANARLFSTTAIINNKEIPVLSLMCKSKYHVNEFAVVCKEFVDPGLEGEQRKNLIENPAEWWGKWYSLLGNTAIVREAYSVIGELLIYKHLLEIGRKPEWRGPEKATHDIECENSSYEIKSTVKRTAYEVTISSIHQLKPTTEKMNLVFCRFEPSVNGFSINHCVQELMQLGCEKELLEKKLKSLSFEEGRVARDKKYKLLECVLFPVDKDFPAITEASFIEGTLPSNLVKLMYTLDLTSVKNRQKFLDK